MLNKPKFMKPSTNKEECTIDLTADKIPFSCIVDGNESIKAWQIVVYDIITNDEVFNTGEITLEPSFYPVDEKNRNVVFSVDLKEHLGDNTTFVNRAEAYYWSITLWGNSGSSTTSYQEVFYANKTPNISFNLSDGDTLTSKDYTFKATYEQKDGVQLKRYGWKITDKGNGQVLVDTITKNQVYGSADNIICSYDGFLNGNNYSVELYIETQNNTKITSSLNFSVSYITTFLSNDFRVETLKNEPAIMLDWSKALVIAGILKDANNRVIAVENTTFKTNYPVDNQCSIEIPDKCKVVYSKDESLNFDIDENSYIAFSTQLLSNVETTLFIAEGRDDMGYELRRQLSYSGGVFKYEVLKYVDAETEDVEKNKVVAYTTYSVTNKPSEYVWYNILMPPLIKGDNDEYSVELNIKESKVTGCIYPSENLYPMAEDVWAEAGSKDFYPIFGKWDNLKEA